MAKRRYGKSWHYKGLGRVRWMYISSNRRTMQVYGSRTNGLPKGWTRIGWDSQVKIRGRWVDER